MDNVAMDNICLDVDLRQYSAVTFHCQHFLEDLHAHDRLQPNEDTDHVLGNLLMCGCMREDVFVRPAGNLEGVENFPHPNNLVQIHGEDLERVTEEGERKKKEGQ
jgi:hypothetical protein